MIITSNPRQVIETGIMPSSISDHDLPYVVLRLQRGRPRSTYMTARSFKGYKADWFYKDLSNVPWSFLDIVDDVEDKLYACNILFNDILDEHAPIKGLKYTGDPILMLLRKFKPLCEEEISGRKEPRKAKIHMPGRNMTCCRR